MEHNGLAPSRGKVLVNGASGGVASIAIDILAQRGYEVVAATRKTNERDYLLGLGAAEVIEQRIAVRGPAAAGDRECGKARWTRSAGRPWRTSSGPCSAKASSRAWAMRWASNSPSTVMPFILRGVRLIGVNSDNEPPLRERLWKHLATDMRPRHLAKIASVSPFEKLPALMQEVAGGRIKGRTVIAVGAR